jgi:RHS repeat-associated protein
MSLLQAGRMTKNVGEASLYSGATSVQELSGSTATGNLLSGGIDEIFTRADSTGAYTPLKDALGSTIALVDSNGNLVTQYSYDPFGNTIISSTTNSNGYQYTGRENEGNGLYFYRARYYSPLLGRFINEDPLGFAGSGPNFYAYVHNSPTNLVDPFGLQDNASPWQVGWEWLSGTGPRVHNFTDGDPFTELLRHHQHIQDLINDVCNGTLPQNGRFDYSLSGIQGVPKYLQDHSTLFTGGLTGNLAVTYLGSYGLSY